MFADVDAFRRRAIESIATVANGHVGWRGLSECCGARPQPATRVAGCFDGRSPRDLLPGPVCTTIDLHPTDGWHESVEIDLQHAEVRSVLTHGDRRVVVTRCASAARSGVLAMRAEGPTACIPDQPPLRVPREPLHDAAVTTTTAPMSTITVTAGSTAVVACARQWTERSAEVTRLTRVAAVAGGDPASARRTACDRLAAALALSYPDLVDEHRRTWIRRRGAAETSIGHEGGRLETAVRFAAYHLLAASEACEELAIGPRGLTGRAYRGHVFWDTDVFVVPALCALDPVVVPAMLRYRSNRLAAAMDTARAAGRAGARFPWESAATGTDVTPTSVVDLRGRTIPVLSGTIEEHIVADVAWAVATYFAWTHDLAFMRRDGDRILVETARYWASRIEVDADGSAHIRRVMGPDEYHGPVDDNAFTNQMARHNLELGIGVLGGRDGVAVEELARWRDLADGLVDGYDDRRRIHEQFAGFSQLTPLLVETIGSPPLSADVIVGHEAIRTTQIVKQPDVLMMHHLLPGSAPPGSLQADLDFYLPRTAHGSSLSPAICASLLARAGRLPEAFELFELAAFLDLDDLTATTAGGLHLATMGGLVQAVIQGFLGIGPTDDGLSFDPRLPEQMATIRQRLHYRGAEICVEVDGDDAVIRADAPFRVRPSYGPSTTGDRFRFRREHDGWSLR